MFSDARASGGKYLRVFTADEPAGGHYTATYTVPVPSAGLYTFTADMTPLRNASWASAVSITVNDKPYETTPTYTNTSIPEIRQASLGAVWLKQGDNKVTFSVDGHRSDDARHLAYIDRIRFEATTFQVSAVDSTAPLDMFQKGNEVALDLRLNARPNASASVDYQVLDYWDAKVASGAVPVPDGSDRVSVALGKLPIGHYRIKASIAGGTPFVHEFAVVVPRSDRPELTDSPFGIDAVGSWSIPRTSRRRSPRRWASAGSPGSAEGQAATTAPTRHSASSTSRRSPRWGTSTGASTRRGSTSWRPTTRPRHGRRRTRGT
ncbi:hypothetical protein [Streptomyces sp. NBC_00893]|uniref:hypothetical protein n=1 Tax=Streptomyces sp. NBC_00893 TaxID=2975862 RepID=UPI002252DA7F|nr:hypothetical protein [Streptomyces sp. NBC_00893]MCX4851577.1 hypothetical protein [Streptomyces sp. NBC_00893]